MTPVAVMGINTHQRDLILVSGLVLLHQVMMVVDQIHAMMMMHVTQEPMVAVNTQRMATIAMETMWSTLELTTTLQARFQLKWEQPLCG
jgi:bifunctional pyridoxal-dependent enzyme with beta-cystathionase and maltose regulon repressor activities